MLVSPLAWLRNEIDRLPRAISQCRPDDPHLPQLRWELEQREYDLVDDQGYYSDM